MYSQSGTGADATVTIVPAVGTATVEGETVLSAEHLGSQAVQAMVYSPAVSARQEASIQFRVVSSTSVYSINVLKPVVQKNFVEQNSTSSELAITVNAISTVKGYDLYAVVVQGAFNRIENTNPALVAPQIVVHFN
jgi:hypothetical protein